MPKQLNLLFSIFYHSGVNNNLNILDRKPVSNKRADSPAGKSPNPENGAPQNDEREVAFKQDRQEARSPRDDGPAKADAEKE